jgi:hypothetical protein
MIERHEIETVEGDNDCYSLPPETVSRDRLFFAAVQVSKFRYVVVEFQGYVYDWEAIRNGTNKPSENPLTYATISVPMTYEEADRLVIRLTNSRLAHRAKHRKT